VCVGRRSFSLYSSLQCSRLRRLVGGGRKRCYRQNRASYRIAPPEEAQVNWKRVAGELYVCNSTLTRRCFPPTVHSETATATAPPSRLPFPRLSADADGLQPQQPAAAAQIDGTVPPYENCAERKEPSKNIFVVSVRWFWCDFWPIFVRGCSRPRLAIMSYQQYMNMGEFCGLICPAVYGRFAGPRGLAAQLVVNGRRRFLAFANPLSRCFDSAAVAVMGVGLLYTFSDQTTGCNAPTCLLLTLTAWFGFLDRSRVHKFM